MAQHTLIKLDTLQNFDLFNFIRIFYCWNPKLFVDYGVWHMRLIRLIYIHWVRPETRYVWVVAFAIKLINFLVGRSVCFLCTQHVNPIFVQSQGSSFGWKHFLRRLIIELFLTACEWSKEKLDNFFPKSTWSCTLRAWNWLNRTFLLFSSIFCSVTSDLL